MCLTSSAAFALPLVGHAPPPDSRHAEHAGCLWMRATHCKRGSAYASVAPSVFNGWYVLPGAERAPLGGVPCAGVKFLRESGLLLSASADSTARLWKAGDDGAYTAAHILTVRPTFTCLPGRAPKALH